MGYSGQKYLKSNKRALNFMFGQNFEHSIENSLIIFKGITIQSSSSKDKANYNQILVAYSL